MDRAADCGETYMEAIFETARDELERSELFRAENDILSSDTNLYMSTLGILHWTFSRTEDIGSRQYDTASETHILVSLLKTPIGYSVSEHRSLRTLLLVQNIIKSGNLDVF